jgi:hypothetical protein
LTKAPKKYDGEKTASSTNVPGKTRHACRRLKLEPCLSHCKNIKVDQRHETLKPVQERVGSTLEHTHIDNNFLNRTTMAQQLKERIDKWDYVHTKGNSHQTEGAAHKKEVNLCQLYI